jgi:hypothetical protein
MKGTPVASGTAGQHSVESSTKVEELRHSYARKCFSARADAAPHSVKVCRVVVASCRHFDCRAMKVSRYFDCRAHESKKEGEIYVVRRETGKE